MEYIVIAAVIALVLPTAHAIWTAYDADMDEWEDELEGENDMPILQNKVYSKKR